MWTFLDVLLRVVCVGVLLWAGYMFRVAIFTNSAPACLNCRRDLGPVDVVHCVECLGVKL